jgi:hypothetical protein
MSVLSPIPVEQLNSSCFCVTLDRERLYAALERKAGDPAFSARDGTVLLAAARLYQGQTTNFRTPGGGFAPVFFLRPLDMEKAQGCH